MAFYAGYERAAVFEVLGRLESSGFVETTTEGGYVLGDEAGALAQRESAPADPLERAFDFARLVAAQEAVDVMRHPRQSAG